MRNVQNENSIECFMSSLCPKPVIPVFYMKSVFRDNLCTNTLAEYGKVYPAIGKWEDGGNVIIRTLQDSKGVGHISLFNGAERNLCQPFSCE